MKKLVKKQQHIAKPKENLILQYLIFPFVVGNIVYYELLNFFYLSYDGSVPSSDEDKEKM